jgi:2-polyprenyl-6-methoxyphenol hydroxylase-like FAD-dependent oxidoreductase
MKKIAIIGGGISGLYIANLLRQNPSYEIIL